MVLVVGGSVLGGSGWVAYRFWFLVLVSVYCARLLLPSCRKRCQFFTSSELHGSVAFVAFSISTRGLIHLYMKLVWPIFCGAPSF